MNTCETCICYYEDNDMGGTIPYCEHVNTPKEPLQDTIPCKYYLHKNIIKKYEYYGNLALQEEPKNIITNILRTIHQLHHYEEKRYDNDEITGGEYITYVSAYANIQRYITEEYEHLLPKKEEE